MWCICNYLSTCHINRLITSKDSFLTSSKYVLHSIINFNVFQFAEGIAQGGLGSLFTMIGYYLTQLENISEDILLLRVAEGSRIRSGDSTESPPSLGKTNLPLTCQLYFAYIMCLNGPSHP